MRKNINKQEEMVSALWDFAYDLQHNKPDMWSTEHDGIRKTAMNDKAIRKAIERLAENFGLELQEVQ
jgi:hypothetical protein